MEVKGASVKRKFNTKKYLTIIMFSLPAMFFYGIFNLFGIVRTFYYSFHEWKGISANKLFIGLDNYFRLFSDGEFWNAVGNNLILVVVSIAVQLPGALVLAMILSSKHIKGKKFFST